MINFAKSTNTESNDGPEISNTIVVHDTNPILATGISLLLQRDTRLAEFMISCSSDDDLQDIATRRPGILIIDPCKPKLAVEAPADLVARVSPTTALIGYCSDPASAQARCIDLAAYRGLMPQTVHSAELVRIVISVAFGGIYVHENYAERLIRPRRAEAEQPANGIRLTEREEEVLRFVARGSSAKEIAAILHLSAKTVDTYKTRANAKLNLRSRSDIVRYAIRSGWME